MGPKNSRKIKRLKFTGQTKKTNSFLKVGYGWIDVFFAVVRPIDTNIIVVFSRNFAGNVEVCCSSILLRSFESASLRLYTPNAATQQAAPPFLKISL